MSKNTQAPKLTIIGRPNVGKSTLFNRLYGRKRALVHDLPGVTRDRLIEDATWMLGGKNYPVRLIDTGGMGGEVFSEQVDHQVDLAVQESDVVLMCLDGQAGLIPHDLEIIRHLQKILGPAYPKKIIIGVVNKVDVESHEDRINDFYQAGLSPLVTISAEHDRGIDDLKAIIKQELEERGPIEEMEPVEELKITRIAITGRPNVGKSTLVNSLLESNRMIVSPIAGTTIDAIDSLATIDGKEMIITDTAGIRRKNKTEQGVEVLSVIQARKALERCDLALLLIDGEEGLIDQDAKIGSIIEEVGCAVIIVVNKWDIIQRKNPKFTREKAVEKIHSEMAFLRYAPILFISAKKGTGYKDLGGLIEEVLEQRKVKLSTHEFTKWVREEAGIHNPMNAKFFLCHQASRNPPTFVCHVSDPDKVHFSLRRHFMNELRSKWGFMGSPVRLLFVKGRNQVPASRRATR